MELYLRVRRACMVDGMSTREASRVFGLHRDTVRKMLAYSAPPGYRRRQPPRRPKIGPYTGVIDRILQDDPVSRTGQALGLPRKQRHTAKRIYDRLRDEYGFDGRYTIVKDYVREHRRRTREMFVPLVHPPGQAQCDFGEALAVIGGVKRKSLPLAEAEDPLLRPGPAPQRCHVRQGIPRGDHRGVLRRTCLGVLVPWRSSTEHRVRQHPTGSCEDTGRRSSPTHTSVH